MLRPQTPKELVILGSAAVSPMTVYALERANNDLVVFLLVICGGIVSTMKEVVAVVRLAARSRMLAVIT